MHAFIGKQKCIQCDELKNLLDDQQIHVVGLFCP